MEEASGLVQRLLITQNSDGGWSYTKGNSWAEPTALSLLALEAQRDNPPGIAAHERGAEWLLAHQKLSGGWSPSPAVEECTTVTSLVALALLSLIRRGQAYERSVEAALRWSADQVYSDSFSFGLLLSQTLNLPPAHAPGSVPWYPGTAGWVTPTALTAVSLAIAARKKKDHKEFQQLAKRCCSYLLSRRCVDEGWNHGGSKTRSEDATSYPETTGVALLALRVAAIEQPAAAVQLARKFASNPGSVEGLSWIQLALQDSSETVSDPPIVPKPRTNRDCALRLIALSARQGRDIFGNLGNPVGG